MSLLNYPLLTPKKLFYKYIFIVKLIMFQVLRVESPDGTKRVQVSPTETNYNLFEKVIKFSYENIIHLFYAYKLNSIFLKQ